jgi:hypothetical protein
MRVIRRYRNRKLYDMSLKRYITFEEAFFALSRGEEVVFRDSPSERDITAQVLYSMAVELDKRMPETLDTKTLRDAVLAGGFQSYIAGKLRAPLKKNNALLADADPKYKLVVANIVSEPRPETFKPVEKGSELLPRGKSI